MNISFKKLTEEDVPLYYEWAEKPHVKNVWFLEGYQPKEYILQKIIGNGIEYPFVILIDNKPIGHIQYWDIHARDQIEKDKRDYFTGEPEGTYGIDIFIGEVEYLGKGYGTKVLLSFTKLLFEQYGAKKIVIDPSTDNKQAIRSYEKAGFHFVRFSEDQISGETMLMELLKPE
ncbi:TPA: GNAT family N-acetyltransferase [Legionella pneumophila subsp. pneumophila]|nr:GNAT family N-acetyltransferase [Legionella pneumophila subsp. pneumophila]